MQCIISRTVIDDSRKAKAPMEIFVGKMFKMEVWETLLTSMRIGEVAEFWCDAVHTGLYPIVSKGMRLIAQGKDPLEGQRHTCGMGNMFHYNTTGWPELDELMRTPQALIFIMELIQVGDPFSYKRESWIMDKDEKMKEVPSLHLQGNALVRQGRFREAAKKYQEAVVLLRIVLSKEMPGDEDYIAVDRLITPLVLNYCQCMLELEEYYEVLEHTSDLIHKHKDCVKAYYKRAKAHAAVWNEKEAKRDFNMVANLDITLAPLVHKELRFLADRLKEKYWEEKEKYWNSSLSLTLTLCHSPLSHFPPCISLCLFLFLSLPSLYRSLSPFLSFSPSPSPFPDLSLSPLPLAIPPLFLSPSPSISLCR
uniref:Aryl hydrocarbon receptor interacting protein like 2 n=1 Tax=Hucho hucho TaxID=62062 RepID=A0A4W5QN97_9TELE